MKESHSKQPNIGLWIFLSIVLILATLVALYFVNDYNVKETKKQEQAKIEADKKAEEKAQQGKQNSEDWTNEMNRNTCLTDAYTTYKDGWDADVKYLGRTDGRLPDEYSSTHEERYKDAKDDCYRQYGF